jgi:hypothetical protein
MTNLIRTVQQTLHWTARAIGAIAVTFWLLILLDIVACDVLVGFICVNWEMLLLVAFVATSIFCVILAWHKEGLGGFVMFLWGILITIFAAVDSGAYLAISILVSGLPFLIAGFFFLASWWLSSNSVLTSRNP